MRNFIIFLVIFNIALAQEDSSALQLWDKFKMIHGKSFRNELEEKNRFDIFKHNLNVIEKHNKEFAMGQHTWKMGLNQFSDLTPEEFSKFCCGFRFRNINKNSGKS